MGVSATAHGRELLCFGYISDQVVLDYGDLYKPSRTSPPDWTVRSVERPSAVCACLASAARIPRVWLLVVLLVTACGPLNGGRGCAFLSVSLAQFSDRGKCLKFYLVRSAFALLPVVDRRTGDADQCAIASS